MPKSSTSNINNENNNNNSYYYNNSKITIMKCRIKMFFGGFWQFLAYFGHLVYFGLSSNRGCYMDSHGSKIFLFQAYSNLIRHLQLESCKMGEVASSKERKKN